MKTLTLRTKATAIFVAIATIAAVSFTVDNSFAQRGRGGGPGFGPGMGGGMGMGPGHGPGRGFGRGPGGPGGQGEFGGPETRILRLADQLELTDDQVEQIKTIIGSATETIEDHRETMQRLKESLHEAVTSDAPDEGIIREIATQIGTAIGDGALIKVSLRQSVLAVLTDEQKAELEELKTARETLREQMEELRATAEELGLVGERPEQGQGFGFGKRRGGRR